MATRTTVRPHAMLAAAVMLVLLAGCSSAPGSTGTSPPSGAGSGVGSSSPGTGSGSPSAPSSAGAPSAVVVPPISDVSVVARDLEVPWGLAFLPDGSALVAERPTGEIVRVGAGGATTRIGRVDGVADQGEGGLLGLAVAPGDPDTVFAYLTSTAGDNRVVAMPFDGSRLGASRVLLSGIPSGAIHNGGRIVIGPDRRLWIGTGDSGDTSRAQRGADLGGKILRIAVDGSIPSDNPDPGSPVWSRGHRNVQGLAFDSAGRLWATEFGQNRLDELNLIVRGGNYGWPEVEGRGGDDRFVDPQVVWQTSEASPSGIAIIDDVAYIGALRGARLWRVPLRAGRAGEPTSVLRERFGRIRTAAAAPDGSLWITTSNRDGRGDPAGSDDRVLRVSFG